MTVATLSTREDSGHIVVVLRGELDVVDAASVMARLAVAVVRNSWIILDLAALEYIDCYALHALGRVREQARRAGGDLLLAAPRRPVQRILDLTGLIGVFSVHDSVGEAVRAAACSRRLLPPLAGAGASAA
jgi:anti-sigma B factor antagonist